MNEVDTPADVEIIDSPDALAVLNASEINVAIATAKKYPRSIRHFKMEALEMATLDEETAGRMFYRLERKGKDGKVSVIEGPSIRMAEVIGCCWTNLRYASRVLEIGEKFVTCQGVAFDMEKNIIASVEVQRRITDRNGRRYGDDMIGVTVAAASSIAVRNAIMRVVPRAYIDPIVAQAKLASVGKAETMEAKRGKAAAWFRQAGVKDEQLLEYVGKPGWDDVTIDDLVTLRGLATALKDGETTIEEAFRKPEEGDAPRARKSKLNPEPTPQPVPAPAVDLNIDELERDLADAHTELDVQTVGALHDKPGLSEAAQKAIKDMCSMRRKQLVAGEKPKSKPSSVSEPTSKVRD